MRKNVVDRCNRSDQVTGFSKFQLFTFWVHFEEKKRYILENINKFENNTPALPAFI